MSRRASLWVGFLAGGWAVTLLVLMLPSLGLRLASAGDPGLPPLPVPVGPGGGPQSGQRPGVGPSVNPVGGSVTPRGVMPVPGGGTADSNNHAIALAASIGGGESVVYYFDTKERRILVYQYRGIIQGSKPLTARDKGGLRLLAARHMDYDLRLEGYRDLSQRTRTQLKSAFEKAFDSSSGKNSKMNPLPTQKVGVKGGMK